MQPTSLVAAFLLAAPFAIAQEIRMFGELAAQGGTLRLVTPHVVLLPGTTTLANEVGHFVDVRGTLLPGTTVPTLAVTAAQRTDHTFELNGGQRIGDTMQLRIDSPTGSFYYFVGSLGPGLLPLDPLGLPFLTGTVFVALPTVTIHGGPLNQSWQEPLQIPMSTGLIGVQIWFQGIVLDGVLHYLNSQHATITAN
jgi:hypothetical protein